MGSIITAAITKRYFAVAVDSMYAKSAMSEGLASSNHQNAWYAGAKFTIITDSRKPTVGNSSAPNVYRQLLTRPSIVT
jgi:hypothetical protein